MPDLIHRNIEIPYVNNISNRDAMMEKKKREIEELRKDSNQGLLAQNKMLRDNPLQTEDYNYENLSKIVGTNNSNIYDPSQRAYGTSVQSSLSP